MYLNAAGRCSQQCTTEMNRDLISSWCWQRILQTFTTSANQHRHTISIRFLSLTLVVASAAVVVAYRFACMCRSLYSFYFWPPRNVIRSFKHHHQHDYHFFSLCIFGWMTRSSATRLLQNLEKKNNNNKNDTPPFCFPWNLCIQLEIGRCSIRLFTRECLKML